VIRAAHVSAAVRDELAAETAEAAAERKAAFSRSALIIETGGRPELLPGMLTRRDVNLETLSVSVCV
jgi:hypothetical protein